jgi:hypothetical protein
MEQSAASKGESGGLERRRKKALDSDLKVEVTRLSNEHYHWMVAEREGQAWKEIGALEYLSQNGAEPVKPSGDAVKEGKPSK